VYAGQDEVYAYRRPIYTQYSQNSTSPQTLYVYIQLIMPLAALYVITTILPTLYYRSRIPTRDPDALYTFEEKGVWSFERGLSNCHHSNELGLDFSRRISATASLSLFLFKLC